MEASDCPTGLPHVTATSGVCGSRLRAAPPPTLGYRSVAAALAGARWHLAVRFASPRVERPFVSVLGRRPSPALKTEGLVACCGLGALRELQVAVPPPVCGVHVSSPTPWAAVRFLAGDLGRAHTSSFDKLQRIRVSSVACASEGTFQQAQAGTGVGGHLVV